MLGSCTIRGRKGLVAVITRTLAKAEGMDQIKNCFVFTVSAESDTPRHTRRFRDPLALNIHCRLAEQLNTHHGLRASKAKPGKACDGGFRVHLPDFDVVVIILAERSAGSVKCGILTWCMRRIWRHVSPQTVSDGWVRVCSAIRSALAQDLRVGSLLHLTEDEASEWL